MIKAEIVADSINQQGDRLTSLVLTYPRIIHAEMMTHRMFSRNASSSRAVPVQKMIEAVKNNTFCPFEFQKAHKGMQGSEYFTDEDKEDCIKLWLESAELALQQAEKMKEKGITKQIINRILEPYQYYTVLITGSKEGWDNFFELRNPVYEWEYEEGIIKAKSKEEFLEMFIQRYPTNGERDLHDWEAVDENFNPADSNFWRSINKGQAEIHMMTLAECIYDAMNESTPKQLQAGEWHIPFGDTFNTLKQEDDLEDLLNDINYVPKNILFDIDFLTQAKLAIATARCARISYETLGDNPEINYEKDIKLHDDLLAMKHMSPFEHCAVVMNEENYYSHIKTTKAKSFTISNNDDIYIDGPISFKDCGWSRNFKGFKQYREIIE